VRPRILDTLPGTDEARNLYIDQEIDDLDRFINEQRRKAGLSKLFDAMLTLKELASAKVAVPLVGAPKKASTDRR